MTWLIPLAAFAVFALAVYVLFLRPARRPSATPDGMTGGAASTEDELPAPPPAVTRTTRSTRTTRPPRAR